MFTSQQWNDFAILTEGLATQMNAAHLKFSTLREANRLRLPEFRNSLGERAHSAPDGSDWSPAQWLQAVVGELGEYANWRKKFERGDIDEATFLQHAMDELADVVTYLDILADQLGIDLGQATTRKFNRVSERVGSTVRIELGQVHRVGDKLLAAEHEAADTFNRARGIDSPLSLEKQAQRWARDTLRQMEQGDDGFGFLACQFTAFHRYLTKQQDGTETERE